jgi:hypothetical protein
MKSFIALAIAAFAFASVATTADARPHKVCYVRHHHRHCAWR